MDRSVIRVCSLALLAALGSSCETTAESSPHPQSHADPAPVLARKPETTQPASACVKTENTSKCWQGRCDHMILLTNRCEATVDCDVSTDVDPGWVRVHLDPEQFFELTTRHGADDANFEVRLECRYYW